MGVGGFGVEFLFVLGCGGLFLGEVVVGVGEGGFEVGKINIVI